MNGLLIRSPWIEQILNGKKTWEIRGSNTKIRGTIALIRSGSGKIVGTCELVDVVGPLTSSQMRANVAKHGGLAVNGEQELPYEKTFAWVLADVRALPEPVSYKHPVGAITWVRLQDSQLTNTQSATQGILAYPPQWVQF